MHSCNAHLHINVHTLTQWWPHTLTDQCTHTTETHTLEQTLIYCWSWNRLLPSQQLWTMKMLRSRTVWPHVEGVFVWFQREWRCEALNPTLMAPRNCWAKRWSTRPLLLFLTSSLVLVLSLLLKPLFLSGWGPEVGGGEPSHICGWRVSMRIQIWGSRASQSSDVTDGAVMSQSKTRKHSCIYFCCGCVLLM